MNLKLLLYHFTILFEIFSKEFITWSLKYKSKLYKLATPRFYPNRIAKKSKLYLMPISLPRKGNRAR